MNKILVLVSLKIHFALKINFNIQNIFFDIF